MVSSTPSATPLAPAMLARMSLRTMPVRASALAPLEPSPGYGPAVSSGIVEHVEEPPSGLSPASTSGTASPSSVHPSRNSPPTAPIADRAVRRFMRGTLVRVRAVDIVDLRVVKKGRRQALYSRRVPALESIQARDIAGLAAEAGRAGVRSGDRSSGSRTAPARRRPPRTGDPSWL